MMTCGRPTCPNVLYRSGLCRKHHGNHPIRGYTPAGPAREHLLALRGRGWGGRELAARAGLTEAGLTWILDERSPHVQARTAKRILSIPVPVRVQALGGRVDSCGTIRRVQGLALAGWSQRRIAAEAGISPYTLSGAMNQTAVLASTAAAVADITDQLQHRKGPAAQVAATAQRRGWVPLLLWDEDAIDDPAARPSRTDFKGVSFVARYRDAREHAGHTDRDQIAAIMGLTRDSLDRQLTRHREAVPA